MRVHNCRKSHIARPIVAMRKSKFSYPNQTLVIHLEPSNDTYKLEPLTHIMSKVVDIARKLDNTHSPLVLQEAQRIQHFAEGECHEGFTKIFLSWMAYHEGT